MLCMVVILSSVGFGTFGAAYLFYKILRSIATLNIWSRRQGLENKNPPHQTAGRKKLLGHVVGVDGDATDVAKSLNKVIIIKRIGYPDNRTVPV